MRALPACAASLALAASAQEIRQTPSAARSSIVLVHNGYDIADAADSITIAVAIRDSAGRAIANLPVRIDVSGSKNFVTPASSSFTDANGLLIANLTSTAAETKTITVTAGEVVLHDRLSVSFRAGPATRFEIVHAGTVVLGWDFFGNFAGALPLDESDQEQ